MSDAVGLAKNKIRINQITEMQTFQTRKGETLSYRAYPAWSENLIVLFHGVGGDSRYMGPLAATLASLGLGQVITPDFRGHGQLKHPSRAPDVGPDQLLQDFEELLIHWRAKHGVKRVYLGGHSMGGGFALKVAMQSQIWDLQKIFLFSCFLSTKIPVNTVNFGGWIKVDGDELTVAYPEIFKTGSEVLEYHINFLNAATDMKLDELKSLTAKLPVHLFYSPWDQVVDSEKYHQLKSQGVQWSLHELPQNSHLGLVMEKGAIQSACQIMAQEIANY